MKALIKELSKGTEIEKIRDEIENKIRELDQKIILMQGIYIDELIFYHIWKLNDNNVDEMVEIIKKIRGSMREYDPNAVEKMIKNLKNAINEIVKEGDTTMTVTIYPGIKSYERESSGRRGRGRGREKEEEESSGFGGACIKC